MTGKHTANLNDKQREDVMLLFHRAYEACNWALDALGFEALDCQTKLQLERSVTVEGMSMRMAKAAHAKQEDLLEVLEEFEKLFGVRYDYPEAMAILQAREEKETA